MSEGHKAIRETIAAYKLRIEAIAAEVGRSTQAQHDIEANIMRLEQERTEKEEAIKILERIV